MHHPITQTTDSQPCTRHAPCQRCALIVVIRHRFAIFEEMFGRPPEPDEPLFFDPRIDHPVQASDEEIETQVISAAMVAEIPSEPVLRFLGLIHLPQPPVDNVRPLRPNTQPSVRRPLVKVAGQNGIRE